VDSRVTDMSFSSSNERTGIEYSGTSLNTLLADRRNALRGDWWRLLFDIVRFNRQARSLARAAGAVTAAELAATPGDGAGGACPGATAAADDPASVEARVARGWHGVDVELELGEFLERYRYSRSFVDNYVLGMGAAIWSKPVTEVLRFPARAFIDFFANHGLLDFFDRPLWRVVAGGSRSYVERMLPDLEGRVHTGTPVRAVRRTQEGVELDLDAQAGLAFDAVVIASHSDQALALLADPSPQEREVLGAIRYQPNDVVLHTDERLLPRHRRAWAAWNYRVPEDPEAPVTVTYDMNILQHIDAP
jgi:predicted NAD/FAD-binding protein